MHCQWQGLNTTVLSPVHRLWRLIALGGRYTGDILAIVNSVITPCFLAVNEMELQCKSKTANPVCYHETSLTK